MTKEKKFSNPEVEIIRFYDEDIIVTSDLGGGNISGVPQWPTED